MKWIILLPLSCVLTSCIFVEGQIIEEPKDVVVSSQAYQYLPDSCQSAEVSKEERTVRHCAR